ncbi:hypothetical protein L1887_50256 [Cichorium endivia]|nr:hypothetical protein L1887_50256 [Cichorium endivia]
MQSLSVGGRRRRPERGFGCCPGTGTGSVDQSFPERERKSNQRHFDHDQPFPPRLSDRGGCSDRRHIRRQASAVPTHSSSGAASGAIGVVGGCDVPRVYSAVWSMAALEQQGSLQPDRVLQAIESSLASSAAQDGEGAVKGVRVAIGRDGSIRVTQRTISAFPSMLDIGSNAARPPSVRLDAAPTRCALWIWSRSCSTRRDARGFYEAAKQRVGADPSVLSGIREGDQRCFDVILWNDEQMDTLDQADAAIPSAPKRLVTESSLANVMWS